MNGCAVKWKQNKKLMLKLTLYAIALFFVFMAGMHLQSSREMSLIEQKEKLNKELIEQRVELRNAVKEKNRYIVAGARIWKKSVRKK